MSTISLRDWLRYCHRELGARGGRLTQMARLWKRVHREQGPFQVKYKSHVMARKFRRRREAEKWARWNYKGNSGWQVFPQSALTAAQAQEIERLTELASRDAAGESLQRSNAELEAEIERLKGETVELEFQAKYLHKIAEDLRYSQAGLRSRITELEAELAKWKNGSEHGGLVKWTDHDAALRHNRELAAELSQWRSKAEAGDIVYTDLHRRAEGAEAETERLRADLHGMQDGSLLRDLRAENERLQADFDAERRACGKAYGEREQLRVQLRKRDTQYRDLEQSLECLKRESGNRCKEAIAERDAIRRQTIKECGDALAKPDEAKLDSDDDLLAEDVRGILNS